MFDDVRSEAFQQLRARVAEVARYGAAAAVLGWDQETFMPPKGQPARARQLRALAQLMHQRGTDPQVGEWLSQAEADMRSQGWDPDSDPARFLKVARREYDRATKVPTEWVAEFAQLTSEAKMHWQQARAQKDFTLFAPYLRRIVAMRRDYASFFAPYDHIYDPLLDAFEPGMKTATVQQLFARLRTEQVALLKAILARPQVDDAFLYRPFPVAQQKAFVRWVLEHMGFDFEAGRLDESAHPFTTGFSVHDVRLTTRYKETDFFGQAFYSSLHEMGHGLYGQGVNPDYEETPLAGGASLGVHESQSRLWENLVGRSRPYLTWLLPHLRQAFPGVLDDVDLDAFYRGVNKVQPSLIRTEADEVTYNLHIMLRLDLEIALLEGSLDVDDLPEVWNRRMEEDLGVRPGNDAEGVLQDIHWSMGSLGYFPTYALGNVMSAQIWQAVRRDLPDLDAQMQVGRFADLLAWLREHIHRYGSKFEPLEVLRKATGQDLQAEPYLDYLRTKYGEIYGL